MAVSIAFLAYSIDLGHVVVAESELQNAADAAATAAARVIPEGNQTAIAAAKDWAARNVAAGDPVSVIDDDIVIGRWDPKTATFTRLVEGSDQTPNAVQVKCHRTAARGNALNLFFAPLMGTDRANLTVSATAYRKAMQCGQIIGLSKVTLSGSSYTDSFRSDSGAYSPSSARQNGHVCSNGDISLSGSSAIRGDAHPGKDHTVKSSSSVGVSGEIEPLEKPLDYPAAQPGTVTYDNDNDTIPLSDYGNQPLDGNNAFNLSGGDAVTISPGEYYFSKLTLSGGSTIRIVGKTIIYVTGDCSMSGGSMANQTLLPENLMLYPLGSKCVISGGSDFYGVVYGPTAKVERSSDSDFYGAIVAAELTLSGSGGIHADESLDLLSTDDGVREVMLVQ
jgi:Flp pilus assembly protein TadG